MDEAQYTKTSRNAPFIQQSQSGRALLDRLRRIHKTEQDRFDRRLHSPHVPQDMIRVSISGDGLHELITEEDDDSITMIFHDHRG